MAFNKTALKTSLETGFKSIFNNPQLNNNSDAVATAMATLIANKMDDFVKTGKATGLDSRGDTHNLPLS